MALDPNEKRINPEDELFWKKVREAHDQIRPLEGVDITFTVGEKQALVTTETLDGYSKFYCAIFISEITNDPPTLVVP